MNLFTVYEPPLVVISIRTSAYTNLRVYEPPLHQAKRLARNKLPICFAGNVSDEEKIFITLTTGDNAKKLLFFITLLQANKQEHSFLT